MQSEITSFPFPILKIQLKAGEQIIVEKCALLSYCGEMDWATKVEAHSVKHWILKFFGKSLTYNIFTARTDAELTFAPRNIGELFEIKLAGSAAYHILPGNHLARYGDLTFDAKIPGMALLSNDLATMRVSGTGSLFVIAYGAIITHELSEGETLIVDDGFLVAFEQQIRYKIKAFGLKRTLVSGEGLMIEITGPGKVYLQSRRKPEGKKGGGGVVDNVVESVSG